MKKNALFLIIAFVTVAAGNLWAYEGATKLVASFSLPEKVEGTSVSALPESSAYQWGGTKLIARFLHRIPEPTLVTERIREEKAGPSLGTKSSVLFRKK